MEFSWQRGLDNVTTIIVVGTSVVMMYGLLTVGIFPLVLRVMFVVMP